MKKKERTHLFGASCATRSESSFTGANFARPLALIVLSLLSKLFRFMIIGSKSCSRHSKSAIFCGGHPSLLYETILESNWEMRPGGWPTCFAKFFLTIAFGTQRRRWTLESAIWRQGKTKQCKMAHKLAPNQMALLARKSWNKTIHIKINVNNHTFKLFWSEWHQSHFGRESQQWCESLKNLVKILFPCHAM